MVARRLTEPGLDNGSAAPRRIDDDDDDDDDDDAADGATEADTLRCGWWLRAGRAPADVNTLAANSIAKQQNRVSRQPKPSGKAGRCWRCADRNDTTRTKQPGRVSGPGQAAHSPVRN